MNYNKQLTAGIFSLVSLCQLTGSMNVVASEHHEEINGHHLAVKPSSSITHMTESLKTGDVERVDTFLRNEPLLAQKYFDYCPPVVLAMMNDQKHGRGLEMLAVLNKHKADFNAYFNAPTLEKGDDVPEVRSPLAYAIYNMPQSEKFIVPLLHYGANPLNADVQCVFNYMSEIHKNYFHSSPIAMSLKRIYHKLKAARSARAKL